MYIDAREIPIQEVLEKYAKLDGVEREKDGYKCKCPIHHDNTPSFKVYEKDNTFYCFGCGIAGTSVDLVRMIKGMGSNDDAERLLEHDYDIEEDAVPSLEGLCERKGLDIDYVSTRLGWRDTDNGVLIPYMGELPEQQGSACPTYKIRTSYKGKAGKPKYIKDGKNIMIPYGLNLLSTYDIDKPLYITEGETDTITLMQAGYQAIGIPGANSFTEQFVHYISPYKIVNVVLDSDKAGNNLLRSIIGFMGDLAPKVFFIPMPNGVKDVNTFHCTNCHKDIDTFRMEFNRLAPIPGTMKGFMLLHEMAPDVPLVTEYNITNYISHIIGDNKIEIDKFVQGLYNMQGKELGIGKTTIRDVAKSTVAMLVRESQELNDMLASELSGDIISDADTCYTYKRVTTQGFVYEPFTSFTVKVVRRVKLDTGEILSVWKLYNEDGRTQEVEIGSSERASYQEFNKKICLVDGFMYRLPPISGFHSVFIRRIEQGATCPIIARCEMVGKHDEQWLFDDYGIDARGEVHYIENGTYPLDGISYLPPVESMPRSLYRNRVAMPVPTELGVSEVKHLLNLLERNQGSKMPWVILGWIGACFARDLILDHGWGFPVCYITGNAQAGKTTLAKWLLKAAGYRDATALGARSSVFGINMLSSAYSNLPIWFDDIRQLGEDGIWNTVILSNYENAGDLKGTKDRTLAENAEYRSGLLITSEFFVKSPAAQSRCLQLVSDSAEQDRQYFAEISRETDRILPYLGANCIRTLQRQEVDFIELLEDSRELLIEGGVNARIAQNFAVALAGLRTMLYGVLEAEDLEIMSFEEYLMGITIQNDLDVKATSYAEELVKDIAAMILDPHYGAFMKNGEDWVIRDGKLLIKTMGLYELWKKYKGTMAVSDYNTRREFIAQLRRLTYAERNKTGTASINGQVVTVLKLDVEKMKESADPEINVIPALLENLDTSAFA